MHSAALLPVAPHMPPVKYRRCCMFKSLVLHSFPIPSLGHSTGSAALKVVPDQVGIPRPHHHPPRHPRREKTQRYHVVAKLPERASL